MHAHTHTLTPLTPFPPNPSFSADATADPLLFALRSEIYTTPYAEIDWDGLRHACSPLDVYDPVTPLMKALQVRNKIGGMGGGMEEESGPACGRGRWCAEAR